MFKDNNHNLKQVLDSFLFSGVTRNIIHVKSSDKDDILQIDDGICSTCIYLISKVLCSKIINPGWDKVDDMNVYSTDLNNVLLGKYRLKMYSDESKLYEDFFVVMSIDGRIGFIINEDSFDNHVFKYVVIDDSNILNYLLTSFFEGIGEGDSSIGRYPEYMKHLFQWDNCFGVLLQMQINQCIFHISLENPCCLTANDSASDKC